MKSKKTKEMIAKRVVKMAVRQAQRTVGHSFPPGAYEVKIPDVLKKQTKV